MKKLRLGNGYYEVPPGRLVTEVTCLEMMAKPRKIGLGLPAGVKLRRLGQRNLKLHRSLFRAVGSDLLWFSRLVMTDAELAAILANADVHSFALMKGEDAIGILELDFRAKSQCELSFFGLISSATGSGLGQALMNEALIRAWAAPITRLWVHTCSHDHPRALGFYQKAGFKAYARMIEVHDDPRISGHLPMGAAPHIPMVDVS